MIVTTRQDILASWLCKKIGLTPTQHIKCIGQIDAEGQRIIAVVGFDGYNGSSVMMHVAGERDANWCTKSLLFATFDYPFNKLNCKVVLGLVPSGNREAIRFNTRIGFHVENVLKDAHPDGSLILMSLRKPDVERFLTERFSKRVLAGVNDGQKD